MRICESRARLGVVQSSLFPQIDTDGSYYYQKRSDASGGTSGIGTGVIDRTSELWSWGTNLSWEIDVFGRLSRLVEAADADICADVELYRNTLIILLADSGTELCQRTDLPAADAGRRGKHPCPATNAGNYRGKSFAQNGSAILTWSKLVAT